MTFVTFLGRLCPSLLLLAIIASLANGLSTVGLLAFTMYLLKGGQPSLMPWQLAFAGLCTIFILSRTAAWLAMAYIDSRAATELRTRLIGRITSTPLHHLEAIGVSRLLTTLTSDVSIMSSALPKLVTICISISLATGFLAYLSWISVTVTLLAIMIIAVGAILYALFGLGSRWYFVQAGQVWDKLALNLEGLVHGIKQLKLNALRRTRFVDDELPENHRQFQRMKMLGFSMNTVAVNWVQLSFAIALGLLLTLLRAEQQLATNSVEFAFVFVCLMAPLETLMLTVGALRDAGVAFQRVQELGLVLPEVADDNQSSTSLAGSVNWKRLSFKGVRYRYKTDRAFTVGPIDLALDRQQIIFVVGGNGSGKSTFAKLLTSLYTPDEGEIYIDDIYVSASCRDWYAQQFSAVFDDSYLFNDLTGGRGGLEESTKGYLRALGLDERLSVSDEISTLAKALSFGQRKRLVLVSALLEDRPIYVFDEWAAQQDENFRNAFYQQLLPGLRNRGKLVIVITHDEGYYHIADRIIRFQDGKLAC